MENDIILAFLKVLFDIQKTIDFEIVNLKKEKNKFKKVEKEFQIIDYFKENNPAISVAINSDLNNLINNDLHCLGISFTIYKRDNQWIFEGETGWSSYTLGFEEEFSIEESYSNFDELLLYASNNVNILLKSYKDLILKM